MKKFLNKNEFSYVISSVTGFTDESSTELIREAIIGAPTIQHLSPRTGIKGVQAIQVLEDSSAIVDGSCGWTASGTTTFSQVDLAVCDKQLQEALCSKDLYQTYQSMLLVSGKPEEEVPFEEEIAARKVDAIQKHIEGKLWTATKAGGDCFDGLSTVVASGQTGVAVSVSGTSFDNSVAYGSNGNPLWECEKVVQALSDDAMAIADEYTMFMSHSNYKKLLSDMTKQNYFINYINSADITGGVVLPNTAIKVQPTIGLNGKDSVVLIPKRYAFFGTDLMSDNEKLDMWFSKDNNELRIQASFSYGVAIKGFSSIKYFAVNGLS